MFTNLSIQKVTGLKDADFIRLQRLLAIYNQHAAANAKKNKYYEGNIRLSDVNLGIALPDNLRNFEIGCEWGAKCVDVLAARSMFDGFVNSNGEESQLLNKIVEDNNLIDAYNRSCKDELKYGSVFATISKSAKGVKIRFHTPETSAAEWNGAEGRIGCGFAIIDVEQNAITKIYNPKIINMYTDTDTIVLRLGINNWVAEYHPHKLGRPLMENLTYSATNKKPFGRSRLKAAIRRLIQGYVRTIANATIGLEFATTPQKYMIGLTDEQYDAVVDDKFKQYVGSILAATNNNETGEKPTFGQFSQGSLEPHVAMLRMLSTQFSAATGLTVTDVGVVNDANPTSSDAILAQSQTLVLLAEQLNAGNGHALNTIAKIALALETDRTLDTLDEENTGLIAHFKNPAMPSVAVTADAAIKIATARPDFSGTDTFLEMIGFDQADIRRIKAQEQRSRGQRVLETEFNNENVAGGGN